MSSLALAPQGSALFDTDRLTNINKEVQNNDPQALKVVAQQFESFFLKQILKDMHNTTFQTGLMGDQNSGALGEYTQWMDTQMAENLSQHGLGLSDALLKQWMENFKAQPSTSTTDSASTSPALPSIPAHQK